MYNIIDNISKIFETCDNPFNDKRSVDSGFSSFDDAEAVEDYEQGNG